ncbi:MAG: hypothetical protein DWQ37_18945 [Planctomycetota bacterium]|nr:MAG: hypothetical protein DWQ37_18945 [Planctomycetota bacterium]
MYVCLSLLRCGLIFSILLLAVAPLSAADKPNIVFILADDLGWTDLGCQGSKYYETPHIDRLAAGGMRFTQGYTCGPNCQPTRAALMSGQYGPRTGTYTVGSIDRFDWRSRSLRPVDNVTALPLDRQTIADAMRKAGYATGMFGKWHLGNDDEHHPSNRGFDEAIVSAGRHFKFKTNPRTEHAKDAYLADFLTEKAVDFIRRHREEPFFLYVPHFGVHSPYQAKDDLKAHFRKKSPSGGHHDPTYAAIIASVDQSVGRIVEVLDELKLSENTLVIFSSDNGGVGGYRREGVDARDVTDNAPLRGGKGMLYEGGVRVPYIFRWPGVVAEDALCDEPINSVDLYPTLVEITGGTPPVLELDGVSYRRLLASGGAATLSRDAIYWHFPGYLGSKNDTWRTTPVGVVRSGDWKLMEFFEDGHHELYNLADDPGEEHDLAAKMPEKVRSLQQRLAVWRKDVGAEMPTPHKRAAKRTKQGTGLHAVQCEGSYPGHLQGVCTDEAARAIYWSFTTVLVRSDPDGRVVKQVDVANHHGDLCFVDGKLYVAVNLGQFNRPAGQADSWVYVYDAQTLAELARHPVPEVVHGAGGIGFRDGRFFVVGGLPPDIDENYVYEYDPAFKFRKRHVLDSGYTLMGIQTTAFADGHWWFGCYGNPKVLLKADPSFELVGRWHRDASLGIVAARDGKLLVGRGGRKEKKHYTGAVEVAVPDAEHGLRVIQAIEPN